MGVCLHQRNLWAEGLALDKRNSVVKSALQSLVFALTIVPMASAAEAACVPGNPEVAGFYTLIGEMEVGSQLVLQPDGRFEFMLAYGAIDQYGRGCWTLRDRVISLQVAGRRNVPREHSPADRRFRGMMLVVEPDGRLAWPLPGFRGRFEKQ